MLAAIYYAMLLTNWGSPTYSYGNTSSFFKQDETSYWCQLVAMWLSQIVYILSLLAPLIFSNRSFA